MKCLDRTCCEAFETNWIGVFPDRFPPYPAIHQYTLKGLEAVEPNAYFNNLKMEFATLDKRMRVKAQPGKAKKFKMVPYDLYCPSMKDQLEKGICEFCGSYWPSKAAKDRHKKCHTVGDTDTDTNTTESVSETNTDDDTDNEAEIDTSIEANTPEPTQRTEKRMPVFENIFDILKGPFTDIDS